MAYKLEETTFSYEVPSENISSVFAPFRNFTSTTAFNQSRQNEISIMERMHFLWMYFYSNTLVFDVGGG